MIRTTDLPATPASKFSSLLLVKILLTTLSIIVVLSCYAIQGAAQTDDGFGDIADDPLKLFERGQGAHSRGELEKALSFYEQAIKVKPDFPEAEFQRGNVLVALNRFDEAEPAYRKSITLKKNWSLPYSALGALLIRRQRDADAEPLFRQALAIDSQDNVALRMLSELRLRAGDKREALELATRAANDKEAPLSARVVLAVAQRANDNKLAAKVTLDGIIAEEPMNLGALMERADLLTDEKNFEAAINDLKTALKVKPDDKAILARLAFVYQQAGRNDEAQAAATAAGLQSQSATGEGKFRVIGTTEEIADANSTDPAASKKALEKLLEKNPRSAMLLARLGSAYRTEDPVRSLDFYRRAVEIDPDSAEYALGYATALVQAKRFAAAAQLLARVIKNEPDNYVAHANLATALYELKNYQAAIPEYEWLIKTKPEIIVAHYFIATSHDYLGEYPEALASYEVFLAHADPTTNQLEIDKVKLRLPTLRRQIQLKEGVKKKP